MRNVECGISGARAEEPVLRECTAHVRDLCSSAYLQFPHSAFYTPHSAFPYVRIGNIERTQHRLRGRKMPLYEYWCPECRAAFEKLRPMDGNDGEVKCPRCD